MIVLLVILGILISVGLWIFYPESNSKKTEQFFSGVDQKLIIENISLRNNIQNLKKKLDALIFIKNAIQQIAPIFNQEILFQRLSQMDFQQIGINNLLIFLLNSTNRQLIPISYPNYFNEYQIQELSSLLNNNILPDLKQQKKTITKDSLYIKDPELIKNIESLIPEFFIITPIIFEQNLIGCCILSTESLSLGESSLFIEVAELFTTHLAYIIKNAELYRENQIKQRELEQAVSLRTQQLKDALEEVSQISKAKSEFVSTVAHELRTSLTAIKGFASLIYQGKLGTIPIAVQERIGKILNQVNRLVEMVNTMLDINKIESGKIEMNPTIVNVHQLFNNVADTFLSQIQEKQLTVTIKCPHNLFIIADPIYIERVIYNLLSNAIKFTPPKGEIYISAILKEDNKILMTVKDTGVGIAPKDIDSIFKEFYHIDHPELTTIRGIGLGLPLVKKVIDAHKGKIWVESELGKGTAFHILIKGLEQNQDSEEN